jgi:hypothetical protein
MLYNHSMQTVLEHLKTRHLDVELHRPSVDEVERVATFFMYNLSGQVVGYQQYRPEGLKKPNNNPREGKYFTFRQAPTVGVWGVESLHLTPHVVFVTEGLFDAARLTEQGVSALAVFTNNPGKDVMNWLSMLGRKVVVVCDGDNAGAKLAKYGDVSLCLLGGKDLGDADDETVTFVLQNFV